MISDSGKNRGKNNLFLLQRDESEREKKRREMPEKFFLLHTKREDEGKENEGRVEHETSHALTAQKHI